MNDYDRSLAARQRNYVYDDTLPQPTRQPVPFQPPKTHSKALKFVVFLLVLALAGAGYLAYLWLNERIMTDAARAEALSYEGTVKHLQTENSKLKAAAAVSDKPVEKDDKTRVTEVVNATILANTTTKASDFAMKISKIGDTFARVDIGYTTGGGIAMILKKVNNEWVIVFKGNDAVPENLAKQYAIPKEYTVAP